MSTSITIHNLDESAASWIRHEAQRQGVNDETIVLSLIHKAVCQETSIPKFREYHELDHLAGTWSKADLEEFLRNTADLERIDPELWK